MSLLPGLKVSENKRYLLRDDGQPFFYLADTAWELFHRLTLDQAETYLLDRADKGFTVIKAVVLAELDGLHTPTPSGHLPLIEDDPAQPNKAYFAEVDRVVKRANELGMYVAMLPSWGDKWNRAWGQGPEIFTVENAFAFGKWLGDRYRDAGIVWVLGGDRMVATEVHRNVILAMARGLREGDEGRHLMTFHPQGQFSSANPFHEEPWLDFNMVQTGHIRDRDNYNSVAADYGRTPVKPVLDGEPGYENIGHTFHAELGRLDAHQVRKFAYWALFSGAFGHTYGCSDIWQMFEEDREPILSADTPWHRALHFPGASQMRHVRRLIEGGPYFDRLPDQSLIGSINPTGPDHVRACRGPDGSYALVYLPTGHPVEVRTYLLSSSLLAASWFDPRTGETKRGDDLQCEPYSVHTFTPPFNADWVLVLNRGV